MITDRCTGACCKKFMLAYSPEELQAKKDEIIDGPQIADMVVYLGHCLETDMQQNWDTPFHHYTCKHFDGKNCTIYDSRPLMCRDYPALSKCRYKACTWLEKKQDSERKPTQIGK